MVIINGKVYDEKTSELVLECGNSQYTYDDHGNIRIHKTQKGNYFLVHRWWVSDCREIEEAFAGKDAIIRFLSRHKRGDLAGELFASELETA